MSLWEQPLGVRWRYGFTYATNLAGATIEESEWTASPAVGITLTDNGHDDTKTSVLVEVTTPGVYVITNLIVDSSGQDDEQQHTIVAAAVSGTAYLTPLEAQVRLARYGVDAQPTTGDLDIASDALDSMRPFTGIAAEQNQAREFPRVFASWFPDSEPVTPAAILDWVALKAYELSTEHEPGVRSESGGRASKSYSEPKRGQLERRMDGLLDPYLLRAGSRA